MVYLVQRIIVNSYGWTKPSPGRLGPQGEGEYVRENGFGHEDWNFNFDLSIRGHIYGYAYYEPSAAKSDGQFMVAFVTYASHRWHLIGFYLNAEYIPAGAPADRSVLAKKRAHLLALESSNSLGNDWTGLGSRDFLRELKHQARWLHWKVHVKSAVRLTQPIPIPKKIFNSTNYRITRPTEISGARFRALRTLAQRTASSEDDDEVAFPEGRELLLLHKARERNPAVVRAAKARFLQKHGKFICQACNFDFEIAYGAIGRGFIEAHHTRPVSELRAGSKTKVTDFALVCSNCHRMLHRRRPWITMSDLSMLVKSECGQVVT